MKGTKTWAVALVCAAVVLVLGGTLTAAFAEDWLDPGTGDEQLAETTLQLRSIPCRVIVGQTVTLKGLLSREAAESTDDGDEPDGDDDWTVDEDTNWTDPGILSSQSVDGDTGDETDGDTNGKTPIAGAAVAIYSDAGGTWSQITTVTTDADGAFVVTQTVTGDTSFSAEFAGDDAYSPAVSDEVAVKVWARVTVPVPMRRVITAGTPFVVRGKATSGAGRVTVTVFKRGPGGRAARVLSAPASVQKGAYTASLRLAPGTYQVAASQAGNSRVHGSTSMRRALKVVAP